jgi:hypothetical protein
VILRQKPDELQGYRPIVSPIERRTTNAYREDVVSDATSDVVIKTIYFEKPGPRNTIRTLQRAKERAEELGIETILVASTRGETGVQAAELYQGYNVVVVSHSTGFREPNTQEMTEGNRAAIEAAGATILTCQHAFGGVNRAVRKQLDTYMTDEIIAYALRTFGEGTKVCAEIALMAADAGLVTVGEPCIAIGGTGRGADTAIMLIPANAQQFFDLRIMEILAKPRHP